MDTGIRTALTPRLSVQALGTVAYGTALAMQGELVAARADERVGDTLLLLEHPHVYTLGRSGHLSNLLLSAEELAAQGIEVHHVARGGDITYHGPGQMVAYPILDLVALRGPLDYPLYVRDLERVLIATVADFGITAVQLAGYSGIWVARADGGHNKLAAIGVHVNGRGISSHGIALNVNTELRYFGYIVPCGIADPDKGVTSMAAQLAGTVDAAAVAASFVSHFASNFGLAIT